MVKTLRLENVDDAVVEELARRAFEHGRTLEDEHRAVLLRGLANESSTFDELSKRLRDLLSARSHTPAEELMRESRDAR